MRWADVAKTNPVQTKKHQHAKITEETYLKSYYHKQCILPNSLPILKLIYFFRLICKNYNVSLGESNDLSRVLLPFFQPSVKIFEDYYQKKVYKNTILHTPFRVMYIDKIVPLEQYGTGYDIVSTFGLPEKIFGSYFRNKYFYINYLSDDGISIEFYEYANSPWINKFNLRSPGLWGCKLSDESIYKKECNFSRIANESKNFDIFLEKIKSIQRLLGFKFSQYAMSPKYKYRKLRQIYYIYKKRNLILSKRF